jgi:glucose/arabinose dehydrogenase
MNLRYTAAALAATLATGLATAALPIERIKLPPGFHIEVFSADVKGARSLALGHKGTVFVGSMRAGNVYAVRNDGTRATGVDTIARGLNTPNGVAVKDGALYVAEIDRIWRYDAIESNLTRPPRPRLVYDKFPKDTHHGWKFIGFGPDGWLYVPVGAPCNVCDPKEPYASITRLKPDGSAMEIFARGVRNSVGFDWDPRTKELWFTDNGADMMGDDLPSDELNHAPKAGMHFGFPYCHQGDTPDPEFGHVRPCSDFTPPAAKLGAHVAALGMRFYTGNMFPAEYRNRVFIAQHGSWNRSKKSGYRVVTARIEDGKAVDVQPFAEGWLDVAADEAWGRPVDVQVMPDGALLVSDDQSGAIYRITYRQPGS